MSKRAIKSDRAQQLKIHNVWFHCWHDELIRRAKAIDDGTTERIPYYDEE